MAGTAPNYDNVGWPTAAGGFRIPTEAYGVNGAGKNAGTISVDNQITLDFAGAHAAKTLTVQQAAASSYLCTNADATATSVTFPAVRPGAMIYVNNTSTSAVTFKVTGQTGIAVATSKSAILGFNGTDFIRLSADV